MTGGTIHTGTVVRKEAFHCDDSSYILLRIRTPGGINAAPGQFVMLNTGSEHFLDRPLSVLESGSEHISLLVQVKGTGTGSIHRWKEGEEVEFKGAFGNSMGRGLGGSEGRIDLIAGGIGIVPLYFFAFVEARKDPPRDVLLLLGAESGSTMEELDARLSLSGLGEQVRFLPVPLREEGITVVEAYGRYLDEGNSPGYVIACGPRGMLAAVQRVIIERNLTGELVLEERMACGRGMCLGCPVELIVDGERAIRRVCMDGPSFPVGRGREVVFT